MATAKPLLGSPRTFSLGTLTFSKYSSTVGSPCRPIFSTGLLMVKPGVSFSMIRQVIPVLLRWVESVLTKVQ